MEFCIHKYLSLSPQKCPPRRVKLAMYGIDPRTAFVPPTIRPFRNSLINDNEIGRQGTDDTE